MSIDAERLQRGLETYERPDDGSDFAVILKAARAHLATLPRYKEVEIVRLAVVSITSGDICAMYHPDDDELANKHVGGVTNTVLIRLTGTAKVKVTS